MKLIASLLAAATLFMATPASAQGLTFGDIDTFRIFHVSSRVADKLKSQGYGRPATNVWTHAADSIFGGRTSLSTLKLSFGTGQ